MGKSSSSVAISLSMRIRLFSPPAPGRSFCPIKRPVSPVDLGFYLTPMAGRLRVAGTVELGGLSAPLNPNQIALLERGVRKLFPDLGPVQSRWLGFRPSLPDSLPVIGPSRRYPNLIQAFGHGHLGMTLAAVTSRIVASLIEKRNDAPNLSITVALYEDF
jgi:glycine/D-amino acid oxidase-like deaminating enzyme